MNRRAFLANAGVMFVASGFVPDFLMDTNKVSSRATPLSRISKLAPCIFWVSDPVRPNEAVVLMGDGFIPGVKIEMARAENGKPAATDWRSINPMQVETQSLKAVVPADWHPGMFAFRVRVGDIVSNTLVANAPSPWWWLGDGGDFATAGGWVRIFGKSLGSGNSSRVRLHSETGHTTELKACNADGYALRVALANDTEPGEYELSVHNEFGDESGWRSAGTLNVRPPDRWKSDIFNVKDFGSNPAKALLSALEKAKANGGGIVFLPRGRYPVESALTIPPQTVLKGESMALVSLYWPDFDKPPTTLITGTNYGLELLTLYCQNYRTVVTNSAASTRFLMRQVRIRADCYYGPGKPWYKRDGRQGRLPINESGPAVELNGKNFEVTDCDIYASGKGLYIRGGKAGLVARNRIRYAIEGYEIESTNRLIFEDNLVVGNDLLSGGNAISTYFGNCSHHIYYAHNRVQHIFGGKDGGNHEVMTLDGGGGAYFGKIAAVDGTHLTLASDPEFHDYNKKHPRIDWVGAAVQILDGKGAGQYRLVTANSGREWQVDGPWTVLPDATSRISITPFRGQNLFIGNQIEDGGPFQLYGVAHDSIVAGNKGARFGGFLVWGLNPHGWGLQPSWFCQFLDNEIVEGNGWGPRSAKFGTVAFDASKVYDGPLVRGTIFRRNVCCNNSSFEIKGATSDTVVEQCIVCNADTGIVVAPTTRGTLLRENIFKDVKRRRVDSP